MAWSRRGRAQWWVAVSLALALLGSLAAWGTPAPLAAQDDGTSIEGEVAASPVASPAATPEAAGPGLHQVFVSWPWRITVVAAAYGASVPEVDLSGRSGRLWAVTVLDVTNWSDDDAELHVRDFGLRLAGEQEGGGLALRTTEEVAARLGVGPADTDEAIALAPEATERIVLVFQVDAGGRRPALMHDRAAMALQPAVAGSARLDALPEVTAPPALETVEVSRVPDGATIESDGATLRLAGITAPAADECFGTRSTNQLIRLAGRSVLVERAPGIEGAVYAWTESGGERQLLNRRLLVDGYAGIDDVEGHPFAGWLTETEHQARYAQRGLWSSCTGPHGVERASGPERAGLEVEIEGDATPYAVWVAWPPTMVTTPDGGAWAFFSAATPPPEGDGDNRLYASRFDPATGEWTPGEPMPGGRVQFGATAVVDRAGRVHVVYSDRRADEERYPSRIVYVTEDGNGGWTEPEPVAPDDEAGYQLFPSLAIDDDGGLHVVWQDQRAWPEGDREAAAVNADIFASSLAPGGAWTEPAMLNTHRAGEVGNRPQIAADGDRLVVVWSIYTTNLGLNAAAYIEWSQRSRSDAEAEWSPPEVLIAGRGEAFGGRLLDLEADPTGGVVLVFGRRNIDTFLFLRRLEPGAERWSSDVLLTYGARGTFPSVAIDDRGTTYVAYHLGEGSLVDVGLVALAHGSVEPGYEFNLTQDEPETQGRAVVTIDATGQPWLIYYNEPPGGVADEVRTLRRPNLEPR